jgi:thymidylate synthase (FAD)
MNTYDNEDGSEWRHEERGLYSVLDHGCLEVIEHWGSDERIVETARMSTGKGFLGWDPGPCPSCDGLGSFQSGQVEGVCHDCGGKGKIPGDAKLLRYLHEKKHSTPFECAGLTVEVQAPIMVFREWHRHRIPFGYSEMSARYVQMPNLHYVPSVRRIIDSAKKSGNRQASGGGVLQIPGVQRSEVEVAEEIRHHIKAEQQRIYELYEQLISFGVSKEIARIDTPVSRYSKMRATGNLRGWLSFLALRMAPDAQFEIRQFAWALAHVIEQTFPRTYVLFNESMEPVLDPEGVDTPERAWKRGASAMRDVFRDCADDDLDWGTALPEYMP